MIGKPTANQCWRLMANGRAKGSKGAEYYHYLDELKLELLLKMRIKDFTSKEQKWGLMCEAFLCENKIKNFWENSVFQTHHKNELVSGLTDYEIPDFNCVGDIKCPQLKGYASVIAFARKGFSALDIKNEFPKYYWQLTAYSLLTSKPNLQLFYFYPHKKQLEEIKEWLNNYPDTQFQTQYATFFYEILNDQIQPLPDHLNNITLINWEVDKQDLEDLKNTLISVNEALEENRSIEYEHS